jgi:dephospho-CoA kinase
MSAKYTIALVGMPGSGKSQAAAFFQNKNIPIIRFGDLTDETMKKKGLPPTPGNERIVREQLRKESGMAAYAIAAMPKIEKALKTNPIVVVDGLYSWEEYTFLKKNLSNLLLLHIFASPEDRYDRLAIRKIRPLNPQEANQRDILEIESLNKAGPIAMANYVIINESTPHNLHKKLEEFLSEIQI